ncbi:Nuclear pore complex protein Nup107 [Galdieria sulphuraria]|nr:Nuclear pore complex protein Nup107 [Galdieria sulphuraria]
MQTPRTSFRRALPFPKTFSTPYDIDNNGRKINLELATTPPHSSYTESVNSQGIKDPANFLSSCETELRFGFFSALSGLELAKKCSSVDLSSENQVDFVLSEIQSQLNSKREIISQLLQDRSLHPVYREPLERLLKVLQSERDTWYLLNIVTVSSPVDSVTASLKPPAHWYDKQTTTLIKCRCILEWCEKVAMERIFGEKPDETPENCVRKVEQKLAPLNDPAYCWSHTSSLEGKTKLDPDYPFRKHELHQTDRHADDHICHQVYILFRVGLLDKAILVTEKVEQVWRGICLLGFFGAWNAASNGEIGQTWNLWKLAAKEIASNPSTNIYERSVFSALCGMPSRALSVCQTWEDQVWIYFFCEVLKFWEEFLFSESPSLRSEEHIFSVFEQCEGIDKDGLELNVMRRVQSFLALGIDLSSHLAQMLLQFLLSCQSAHEDWSWFLRFSAHVVILLRISRGNEEDELFQRYSEQILLAYCKHLLFLYVSDEMQAAEQGLTRSKTPYDEIMMVYFSYLMDESNLVTCCVEYMVSALKADTMTEQVRLELKSRQLSQLHSDERRTSCLGKIGQYLASFPRSMLNKIVETAVAHVWNHYLSNEESDDVRILDSDLFLIRSVDFLIFPAYQNYHLAVACVNLFVRKFILSGKVLSAQNTLDEISEDVLLEIEKERSLWSLSHEFRCWQQFFKAWDAILEWRKYAMSQRPASLPSNISHILNPTDDNVSTEEQLWARHVLENYETEWKQYLTHCNSLGEILSKEVISTLTMEGGWLVDSLPYEPPVSVCLNIFDHVERQLELEKIRRQYVPLMLMQLVDVYKQMGKLSSCVELVQLVAEDASQFLSDLGTEVLEPFMQQIIQVYLEYCDEQAQSTKFPFVGELFEATL